MAAMQLLWACGWFPQFLSEYSFTNMQEDGQLSWLFVRRVCNDSFVYSYLLVYQFVKTYTLNIQRIFSLFEVILHKAILSQSLLAQL